MLAPLPSLSWSSVTHFAAPASTAFSSAAAAAFAGSVAGAAGGAEPSSAASPTEGVGTSSGATRKGLDDGEAVGEGDNGCPCIGASVLMAPSRGSAAEAGTAAKSTSAAVERRGRGPLARVGAGRANGAVNSAGLLVRVAAADDDNTRDRFVRVGTSDAALPLPTPSSFLPSSPRRAVVLCENMEKLLLAIELLGNAEPVDSAAEFSALLSSSLSLDGSGLVAVLADAVEAFATLLTVGGVADASMLVRGCSYGSPPLPAFASVTQVALVQKRATLARSSMQPSTSRRFWGREGGFRLAGKGQAHARDDGGRTEEEPHTITPQVQRLPFLLDR